VHGTRSWENESLITQIDVVLPTKLDRVLIVRPRNGSRLGVLSDGVGVGRIEITERYGCAEISDRRKFIVTMMPEKHIALEGFSSMRGTTGSSFLSGLRADLWKKKKPFVYLDTIEDKILAGHCE
jgi:hypothetical protein